MPGQSLELRTALSPAEVTRALHAAAVAEPMRFGVAWRVEAEAGAFRIHPPPVSHESLAAACAGRVDADGAGALVRVHAARLSAPARRVTGGFLAVSVVLCALVSVQGWRGGELATALATVGAFAFIGLVIAAVAISATGTATDEVRRFVRRALAAGGNARPQPDSGAD